MIKLDVQSVIFFYVCLPLVALVGLWVFAGRGPKVHLKEREDVYMWKCAICSHDYIDSTSEDISVCPLCGSYNKKTTGAGRGQ
jgi:hypothetical protein